MYTLRRAFLPEGIQQFLTPKIMRHIAVAVLTAALSTLVFTSAWAQTPERDDSQSPTAEHRVKIYPVRPHHDVPKDDAHHSTPSQNSSISPGPSGAHLTYYGGPVVSSVKVVVVYYGSGSYLPDLSTGLPSFYSAITNGTFMDMLSEYSTQGVAGGGTTGNQIIARGGSNAFLGSYTITPSAANDGATITDSQIQAELQLQINGSHLPAPDYDANGNADTIYMIYFPSGKAITQGGSSSCVSGGFCAYHGTISANSRNILYGVQPDMQSTSGCYTGCGNASTTFGNYTSVASHEFAETITDAAVGLATVSGPPLAWYDNTNGEIGDICNAIQNQADGYTVQAEWSNLQNGCAVGPVTFGVTAPSSASAGTAFNVTVQTKKSDGTSLTGYTGTIHFTSTDSAATLPADYTFTSTDAGSHTFSGVVLHTTGSQTVTATGAVNVGFTGTSSAITVGTASNNFSIAASPSAISIAQGGSGSSTISTAVTSGSAATVSLALSGVPSGVTAGLSPASVTAGGSSTLSISVGTSATPGTYTLTITGTEGSVTHATSIALTVTSTTVSNDFSIAASPSSVSVAPGASGTSTISTAVTSGTAGTVSFAASGAPAGVTASLSPASVTAGGSAMLTLAASSSATPGSYTITITGTEGSVTHSTTVALTITSSGGIVNGGFESGLTGWTTSGASVTIATSGCHSGTKCALAGSTSPTNGDSTLTQTFTAPTGATGLSFWFKMTCPDTVTYDWMIVTLKNNTAGTTTTLVPKTCMTNAAWVSATAAITAGSSYTLTLTSHDDDYSGDPTYTLFDDVALTTTAVNTGITNGGFENGKTGWTTTGASTSIVTSGCHGGTSCAMAGASTPTNGDSSFSQTFVVPSGKSQLSLWYNMTCPDSVTYDWMIVTLKNNTTGTTATMVQKNCAPSATWTAATAPVTAGSSYTLTLTSHDDNYPGDASYTLYDDVSLN